MTLRANVAGFPLFVRGRSGAELCDTPAANSRLQPLDHMMRLKNLLTAGKVVVVSQDVTRSSSSGTVVGMSLRVVSVHEDRVSADAAAEALGGHEASVYVYEPLEF